MTLLRVKQNGEVKYHNHPLLDSIKTKPKISSSANQGTQRHKENLADSILILCLITRDLDQTI